ncbi:MAG TPA: UDP-glucose 4-epimerase GalE [Candidatus Angelobacter sp.]|nr:UDP-glucose 4-epimerase GalE [Candidatus Angelobacter sp.]
MKILVSGGAGFVGSVCCAELVRQGHSVLVVDDLSSGHAAAIPRGATFHRCDIGNQEAMAALLRDNPIDIVFHFAAKALIAESMSNPGFFFRHNVAAGIIFLETLRNAGISKFVFSSSAAVYGAPRETPIHESHPKQPVNSYGETKLMFERILDWYVSAYGWTAVSFRYFNACGATAEIGEDHRPETHVIPLLLRAASRGGEFHIHGDNYATPDGTCMRDYVHVEDIAAAHLLALQVAEGAKAYNIGTGHSYSVLEVCQAVEEVTGHSIDVRKGPRRPGDPPVLCASPDKLKEELGWNPKHSDLHSIIRSAWHWKRSHPDGYISENQELVTFAR